MPVKSANDARKTWGGGGGQRMQSKEIGFQANLQSANECKK